MIKKITKKALYGIQRNPLSKALYLKEINYRSTLPLTALLPLSKPINVFSPFTEEIHPPNDWYGHAKIFKQFLGISRDYQFKFIIEHGLHFIDKILNLELENDLPSFLTYSNFRAKIIKKYGRQAFCIGPYIYYAPHYLAPKQLLKEKNRLGKSVLLFPSHSTGDINMYYDISWLCQKVKEVAKNYDTIRVCLYWKDVLRGHAKFYQSFGFECITAGHILDPLFLPRLKSIIETSTITLSNDMGNHVGYSVFMNRPHHIIIQDQAAHGRKSEENKSLNLRHSRLFNLVSKPFIEFTSKITPEQRSLVNYYWGLNNIKTKGEFMKIIQITEGIYQKRR